VQAPIVPFPIPACVASPEWLNASRLGRNTRTRGTATSRTQEAQTHSLMHTAVGKGIIEMERGDVKGARAITGQMLCDRLSNFVVQ
jgi:hypothetical protein